jgi:tRNA-dihydrouridine synthase A
MKKNQIYLPESPDSRFSIAPMMEYTDRFFRCIFRQISKNALLYTEMIAAETLFHAEREKTLSPILFFHEIERPIIAQLGGADPQKMANAARICADFGYDGININAGCPSERVQFARMGACLMKEPETIARCIEAIRNAVNLPVSLKHRIGVDDLDSYEYLSSFIERLAEAGTNNFIIHARKARLKGLSPAQNRTIPELKPQVVYQLKKDFPQLKIEINGNVKNLNEIKNHLLHVDGVMVGRAAYNNPWEFHRADTEIFSSPENPSTTLIEFIDELLHFLTDNPEMATRNTIRHLMGIMHGKSGARQWRSFLSESLHSGTHPLEILESARLKMCSERE